MDLRLLASSAVWGVGAAGAFSLVRAWRHRQFSAGRTAIVFIAGAALPSYARLLRAALLEKVEALPPDWPQFAGLAAVVALGLAIQQLFQDFGGALAAPPATRAQMTADSDERSRSDVG